MVKCTDKYLAGWVQGLHRAAGWSLREIASVNNLHRATVRKLLEVDGEDAERAVKRRVQPRVGRRRGVVKHIAQTVSSKSGIMFPAFPSSASIAEEYLRRTNKKVSAVTIRRDCKAVGLKNLVRKFVPCSNPEILLKRFQFSKLWLRKTDEEREGIVFSDEHMVSSNDYSCRTMWCVDKSDVFHRERLREQNALRIHIWTAISVGFKGPLVIFPERRMVDDESTPFRVTADEYVRRCINIVPRSEMKKRIFMQDNARIHTAWLGCSTALARLLPRFEPNRKCLGCSESPRGGVSR
jgi:hypothetical protein